MSRKIVWKTNDQDQLSLLPPSYDDLVPKNHPVRIVNSILEGIDLGILERTYKGGGTSSYHPKVLLKILVYAYLRNLYSSRKIEEALGENLHFMWLAGTARPDHNTISNFRSGKLKGHFKRIFDQVVVLLAEQGHLSLKDIYVDGTKIEANANRYTFVWAKGIKTSRERIQKQLKELWGYVEKVYQDEEQTPNMPDFEAIDPQKVSETIDQINQALEDRPIDKKVRQKLNYAKRNWPKNLERYDRQEGQMGGRNSMSRTDPDATFMRMKDDHMQNGQLKPGYNLQAGTNNQFIVNYSLAQTTSDTTALIGHVEGFIEGYGRAPEKLTADAGYGSEENYAHLEGKGIEAFVKYGHFHKEQLDEKRGTCKSPFAADKLYYDSQGDRYFCPMGQAMEHVDSSYQRETKTGYLQTIDRYRARNCSGCPMRGACHQGKGNRTVERNHNLARLRATARERLLSEEGIAHRKRRCWDVEAVFGNIKQNMGFKRFLLRGIDKVETEIGLIAMAHNLKKATLRA